MRKRLPRITIKIVEIQGRYNTFVTTHEGRRYISDWADEPTEAQVMEAWQYNRMAFQHIN